MANILVIDDEEIIRSLAERILQRDFHNVLLAETGSEAVVLFQKHSDTIDIALVDMNLEEMNGLEILTEFRKINPNIPGIISSGNTYDQDDIPEILNNYIYFLQKPYRANELSELIDSILIHI